MLEKQTWLEPGALSSEPSRELDMSMKPPHTKPRRGRAARRSWAVARAIAVSFASWACVSGGLDLQQLEGKLYRHADLAVALASLSEQYGSHIEVVGLGQTHQQREIYAVKISGDQSADLNQPELLAVFAQHGAEHTMTNLAVDLIRQLADRYGGDDRVTSVLDSVNIWIVPMVNPDGVEHDLSGTVKPFTWRKNRTPLGADVFGVDLNRNWARIGAAGEAAPADQLDPSSDHYWGPTAFSEPETQALRDFIGAHPRLEFFLDYHTGSGGFLQGVLGCWMPRGRISAVVLESCLSVVDGFADTISDHGSDAPPFQVTDEPEDIIEVLGEHAPVYLKPFLPDVLPPAAGVSTDYVSGEKGIPGIGIEIDRDRPRYFEELPASQQAITERHLRGLLYLAKSLSREPGDLDPMRH